MPPPVLHGDWRPTIGHERSCVCIYIMYVYYVYIYEQTLSRIFPGSRPPASSGIPFNFRFPTIDQAPHGICIYKRTVAAARSNTPSALFPPYCGTPSIHPHLHPRTAARRPAPRHQELYVRLTGGVYTLYRAIPLRTHAAQCDYISCNSLSGIYRGGLFKYIMLPVEPLHTPIPNVVSPPPTYMYTYILSLQYIYIAKALYKSSRPDKPCTQFIIIILYILCLIQTYPIADCKRPPRYMDDFNTAILCRYFGIFLRPISIRTSEFEVCLLYIDYIT